MIFDMPTCGGCRTCEIACSFHHTGEFKPWISSIKIRSKEGNVGYYIELLEKDGLSERACDTCSELDIPLCMEHCKEMKVLGEFLQGFRRRRKMNN